MLQNIWPWALAAVGVLLLLRGNADIAGLLRQVAGFFGLGGGGAAAGASHDMATVSGRFACYDCLANWLAAHGQAEIVTMLDREVAPKLFDRDCTHKPG